MKIRSVQVEVSTALPSEHDLSWKYQFLDLIMKSQKTTTKKGLLWNKTFLSRFSENL